MKITLLQQDIVWADPAANQKLAEEAIMKSEKSDLYVLPEMWSTGFATHPEGIAENSGASLQWMQQMADRMDAAIAGSIAMEENGRYYNRFYFVMPRSIEEPATLSEIHYDKHHLFTYGGEHLRYTPGTQRVVVEWRGVKFLLQVCYDLRFPVFSRNALRDVEDNSALYDAIIYVASWPVHRRDVWDTLLKARAIENQCYVLGVNRIGSDQTCDYNGGTVAIDAYGRTVAACADRVPQSITVTLDLERLEAFRQKFPVLHDADGFTLGKDGYLLS